MKDFKVLLGTFLLVLIALYLTPAVAEASTSAAVNTSTLVTVLLGLVPVFWVIGIVVIAAAVIYTQVK